MTMVAGAGDEFEALARQYWNAWGQALRQGSASAGAWPGQSAGDQAAAGWRQVMDWWNQSPPAEAAAGTQDSFERARDQAGDWLAAMQQVAARFAGRDNSSAEVAQAWRETVESQGERLLRWSLGVLRGAAADGADQWLHDVAGLIERWRHDSAPWLQTPTFGLGRNHQQRWQTLARAQQDYQAQARAYAEQIKTALDQAFRLFEDKLTEIERAGSQLGSARALFDLWIEAAEEAYSVIALSEEFRRVYGAFANAQLRLRGALQQEIEQLSQWLGLPTRSEMDAAHRRITELERQLRRMARAGQETVSTATAATGEGSGSGSAPGPARKRGSARAVKPGASRGGGR